MTPAEKQWFAGRLCDSASVIASASARAAMLFSIAAGLLLLPAATGAASNKGEISVGMKLPTEAELGKSVNLECTWKLSGNNTLYSTKWYKDEHEFFSYNPDNEPSSRIKTFQQNGVNIDVRTSTKNLIRLTQLTLNSSGEYKCEVSTGAPFFATNYRKANLTVIALPSQGPEITGLTSSYAVGENVTANCTSWPSVPKARIHWVVNNRTVSDHYVVEYPPLKPVDSKGLMTYPNSLGLRMELNSRHVAGSGGTLRVRCVAHIGSKKFETEKHVQLAHANNQRFSAGDLRSGGATCTLTLLLLLLTSGLATT